MLVANLATLILAKAHVFGAFWLFQEDSGQINFGDPLALWRLMAWPARIIVIILLIMSAWSIRVMIAPYVAFTAERRRLRHIPPAVAGPLREGPLDSAIGV